MLWLSWWHTHTTSHDTGAAVRTQQKFNRQLAACSPSRCGTRHLGCRFATLCRRAGLADCLFCTPHPSLLLALLLAPALPLCLDLPPCSGAVMPFYLAAFQVLLFLEELSSVLLTPFILAVSLPRCAGTAACGLLLALATPPSLPCPESHPVPLR